MCMYVSNLCFKTFMTSVDCLYYQHSAIIDNYIYSMWTNHTCTLYVSCKHALQTSVYSSKMLSLKCIGVGSRASFHASLVSIFHLLQSSIICYRLFCNFWYVLRLLSPHAAPLLIFTKTVWPQFCKNDTVSFIMSPVLFACPSVRISIFF